MSKSERANRGFIDPRAGVEVVIIAVVALVAALLIRTFLLQLFYIPTESMVPTLNVNDKIAVNKLAYKFHGIERGDIIVFKKPEKLQQKNIKHLVKRVVGLPGDKVKGECPNNESMCEVQIYVNGKKLNEPYLVDGLEYAPFEEIDVPANSILVLGDNRPFSQDGRFFGPIPKEKVIGRVLFKVWPLSGFGFL